MLFLPDPSRSAGVRPPQGRWHLDRLDGCGGPFDPAARSDHDTPCEPRRADRVLGPWPRYANRRVQSLCGRESRPKGVPAARPSPNLSRDPVETETAARRRQPWSRSTGRELPPPMNDSDGTTAAFKPSSSRNDRREFLSASRQLGERRGDHSSRVGIRSTARSASNASRSVALSAASVILSTRKCAHEGVRRRSGQSPPGLPTMIPH